MTARCDRGGGNAPVVVTGIGALCALGEGVSRLWTGIDRGESGIDQLERFARELPGCLAATLPAPWSEAERWSWGDVDDDPLEEIALAAAREAWVHAGLDRRQIDPARLAVVFGTSGGGMVSRSRYELCSADAARRHRLLEQSRPEHVAAALARALGIDGPRLTISTACTSSAHAVAHGRALLARGAADVVLAGGAEVVAAEFVAGFRALGVLSPQPCAPFSEPTGMTIGEGAAFVVLERAPNAGEAGVPSLAAILGCGLTADAFHATAPDPSGAHLARAIVAAVEDAGLSLDDIGYVNAHGTGTEANDPAECRAIRRAFGERAATLPVSSSKGHFGHTRGAAGALELVTTVLALRHQTVPPTLHFGRPRPGASPADPVPGPRPRPHSFDHAVTLNAAFGGTNAAIVVGKADTASHLQPARDRGLARARSDVLVLGHGALLPSAAATPRLGPAGDTTVPLALRLDAEDVAAALRGLDTRGMDTLSRYLAAAFVRALRPVGVRLRGELRDRTGILVGASRLPWDSAEQFWTSLRTRGFERASAPAFARLVMSAPAGAVSRALGLRGPISVVAGGVGSTLRALVLARWMLLDRRDVQRLLVGSAVELAPAMLADFEIQRAQSSASKAGHSVPTESAACVLLAAPGDPSAAAQSAIAIVGGALTGPRRLTAAAVEALRESQVPADTLDAVFIASDRPLAETAPQRELHHALGARLTEIPCVDAAHRWGPSEALDALALLAALDSLAPPHAGSPADPGRPRRVLVAAANEHAGSVAVLLEARRSE